MAKDVPFIITSTKIGTLNLSYNQKKKKKERKIKF